MKKYLPFLIMLVFTCVKSYAFLPAAPANDDCINAVDITVANATVFTTVDATASSQPAYITGANDDDVWFKFTAGTAAVYKISLANFLDAGGAPAPPSAIIELWNGCSGTAVNITNTQGNIMLATGLTNGVTYYIRIYTNGTAQRANFNIAVTGLAVPANDNCNTAAVLHPVTACTTGEGPFSTEAATASPQPSGDGTGKDDDVWFTFTTGATNVYAGVSLLNPVFSGGGGSAVIELWNNCGDASSAKFLPFSLSANFGTLLPNTTYYIRVYTYGTTSWLSSFNICVTLGPPPPANDTYFNAANLPLNRGTNCTGSVTGASTSGATAEFPNDCSGMHLPKDIWYKFKAVTATGHIQISNKTLLPGHVTSNDVMWMQVFDGSNTSPTLLCSNTGALDFTGATPSATLIPGHTYYVRIYNDDAGNACSFDICTVVPPAPAYNDCAKAVHLAVSADENCSAALAVTNVNASASLADGSCLNNVGNDIWFQFRAPSPGSNLQVSVTDYVAATGIANPLMGIVVYSGSCGSLTSVSCGLGTSLNITPDLNPGQMYYIRIISADPANSGNFKVCLHYLPAAASNTDCAHAADLNVSTDASAQFIHASTAGTAFDNTLTDCFGNNFVFSNAVWFKFTAAAAQQLIDIQNIISLNGQPVSLGYKFYIGDGTSSCTGISSFYCTSDVTHENLILNALIPGKIYFVQVLINKFNGGDASFNIRVIGNSPPVNDEVTGAVTIIENPVYKPQLATQGTFRFSTISASPAPLGGAVYGGDVWYRFIAATTDATLRIDNGGAPTRIVVYNSDASTVFYDPGVSNAVNHLSSLTIGNTYYVRVYNPQALNSTAAGSIFGVSIFGLPSAVTANIATPGASCQTVDGPVVSSNSNRWLHITDQGKLVASIFDYATGQPAGLGNITASYYINGGNIRRTPGGTAYMDRNYSLLPTREPAGGNTVKVIFYFNKTEFDRLVASANSYVNFLNDLDIAAYSTQTCSNIISNLGVEGYGIVDYGAVNSDVYYFEVTLPHLSSFYLQHLDAILPVTCGGFNYTINDNKVVLQWKTTSETNSSHFEVQKSFDGNGFSTAAIVKAAGNSSIPLQYSYTDNVIKAGSTVYYRLKEFDKDGQSQTLCNTVKVTTNNSTGTVFGAVYPNPVKALAKIDILRAFEGKVSVVVVTTAGQVVSRQEVQVNSAASSITINTAALPKGIYVVKCITRDGVYTQKFTRL